MGTRTRETTFRQDDTREKREEDVYKILIVNCKSSPNTVLYGYHALESPPFYSLQKLCDNYSYCDILGGWVGLCVLHTLLSTILHYPGAQSQGSPQTQFTIKRGKEWVLFTVFPKSLSISCPFPLPLSTSQMESVSLTHFHTLQVKIGPDRLTPQCCSPPAS